MSAAGIYKPGQGYWTRMVTAISAGLLTGMGMYWLWGQVENLRIGDVQPVYIQGGAVVIVAAVCGLLGFWLIGRNRKVVDFMVATEGEMKKVNWSTRREVLGATWVVIGLTILIAIWCRLFDLVFLWFFQLIKVLEGAG